MKIIKEDFFTRQFYEIDNSIQPFAFKVLDGIYFNNDKGLNIKEIYNLFNNNNSIVVRKAIKLIEELLLVQVDKNKSKGTEKRYFITASGKQLVNNHYNNNR